MMWLTAALQVILLYQVARTMWRRNPLLYLGGSSQDFYFDRIAALTLNLTNWNENGREKVNVAIGVWITSDRLLTSYNPFRSILQNETLLPLLISSGLAGRTRTESGSFYYTEKRNRLACGRQVQFLPDEQIIKDNLWHGTDRKNCPLHDLMVFRIYGNNTVSNLTTEQYTMAVYPDGQKTKYISNIFLTQIAKPHEQMGGDFIYAELSGHYTIRLNEYDPDDNGVVDCDEWLPREWGHFICIRNKNNRKTMASGAMLVSDEKLFGVGSFLIFRGEESILVFTDVRPYYRLIFDTCTYNDSEEIPPESFPENKELFKMPK